MLSKYKSIWLPTLIFIVFAIVTISALQTGETKYYNLKRTLTQWDGQLYLSIARDGYEKFPCAENRENICGNIGWFPIYPAIAALISAVGIPVNLSLLFLSFIALWLSLIILYKLVEQKYNATAAVTSVLALVFFPSSFYFLTAFPYSLYLLFAVSIFYLIELKHFKYLFILCGLLAVTYPSGIIIGLPLLYYLIKNFRTLNSKEKLFLYLSIGSLGVALAGYGFYYMIKFGDFFLYQSFQAQSYYAHEISFPLYVLAISLADLSISNPVWVTIVFVYAVFLIFYNKKVDVSWQIFALGVLLFTPTFGTTDSYYRHIIVAFPLFVLIGIAVNDKYRKYLVCLYFLVSIYLSYQVFLPAYKSGLLM